MTTPPPADTKPAFSEEVDVFYEFTEPPGGVPLDRPTALQVAGPHDPTAPASADGR